MGGVYYVVKEMRDDVWLGGIRYYVVAVNARGRRFLRSVLRAERLSELPLPPACYVERLGEFMWLRELAQPSSPIIKHINKVMEEGEFRSHLTVHLRNRPDRISLLEKFMKTARNTAIRYPLVFDYDRLDAVRMKRKLSVRSVTVVNRPSLRVVGVDFLARLGFLVSRGSLLSLLPYKAEEVDPEAVAELDSETREYVRETLAIAAGSIRGELNVNPDPDLERVLPVVEHALLVAEMLK